MYEAYHIKNDGTDIPVKVHVYAQADLMRAIAFLLKYSSEDKEEVVDIFTNFMLGLMHEYGSLREEDILHLQEQTEMFRESYVNSTIIKLFKEQQPTLMLRRISGSASGIDYIAATTRINEILDQVFLRARYGGYYIPEGSREMVFRVSSHGFDWSDIICKFVYNNRKFIDRVTIVRDTGGTGTGRVYFNFENLPVEEYLMGNRKIISNKQFRYSILESGARFYSIRANRSILQAMKSGDLASLTNPYTRKVTSPRTR